MPINEPGGDPHAQPNIHLRLIAFELGRESFCVAASAVLKIVQPMQISALPNSPAWLLGLAAERGEIVAVIDPSVISPQAATSVPVVRSKTVVFHTGPGRVPFALPIDRLQDTVSVPNVPLPSLSHQPAAPIYEFEADGRRLRVIDHESLFRTFSEIPQ